jgi:hypothetical protein
MISSPVRRLVAALAVVGVGAAATFAVGLASAGGTPPARPASSPAGESRPFDPVEAALGVSTDGDRARLRAAQDGYVDRLAATSDDRATDGLDRAVERLYEAVRRRPAAEVLRRNWRGCMAEEGFRFEDPAAVEAAIEEATVGDGDGEVSSRIEALVHARERCTARTQPALDDLVRREFPRWRDANRAAIDAYAGAIGFERPAG